MRFRDTPQISCSMAAERAPGELSVRIGDQAARIPPTRVNQRFLNDALRVHRSRSNRRFWSVPPRSTSACGCSTTGY